jgi:hypothetical protein
MSRSAGTEVPWANARFAYPRSRASPPPLAPHDDARRACGADGRLRPRGAGAERDGGAGHRDPAAVAQRDDPADSVRGRACPRHGRVAGGHALVYAPAVLHHDPSWPAAGPAVARRGGGEGAGRVDPGAARPHRALGVCDVRGRLRCARPGGRGRVPGGRAARAAPGRRDLRRPPRHGRSGAARRGGPRARALPDRPARERVGRATVLRRHGRRRTTHRVLQRPPGQPAGPPPRRGAREPLAARGHRAGFRRPPHADAFGFAHAIRADARADPHLAPPAAANHRRAAPGAGAGRDPGRARRRDEGCRGCRAQAGHTALQAFSTT